MKPQLCSILQTFLRMAGGCEGERPCPLALCPLPVAERVMGESIQALPWPEPLIPSQQTPPSSLRATYLVNRQKFSQAIV